MATPDFVTSTLRFIDENWKRSNYTDMPVLIDRRDSSRYDTGERGIEHDLETGNAVSVGDSLPTSREPEGLGWHSDRVEAGVSVRIEGLHTAERGDVADASDFDALVDEVRRCLQVERVRPLDGYLRLEVRDRNSQSGDNHDYFRADLACYYIGHESLP